MARRRRARRPAERRPIAPTLGEELLQGEDLVEGQGIMTSMASAVARQARGDVREDRGIEVFVHSVDAVAYG